MKGRERETGVHRGPWITSLVLVRFEPLRGHGPVGYQEAQYAQTISLLRALRPVRGATSALMALGRDHGIATSVSQR